MIHLIDQVVNVRAVVVGESDCLEVAKEFLLVGGVEGGVGGVVGEGDDDVMPLVAADLTASPSPTPPPVPP